MPYFSEDERERGQRLLRLIRLGDQGAALELLSSGTIIDLHQLSSQEEHGVSGLTPLMLAARLGFAQIILPLLNAGARADAVDFQGRTALMTAAICAHAAAVHILMHRRATSAASPRASPWLCFIEFENAIAKIIEHVPNPSIQHASCALLLLYSVRSEAARLWSFFPAQLKQQTLHLQHMLNFVKCVARTQPFERLFHWEGFTGLQITSTQRATSAVLGSGGIVLGTGNHIPVLMHANLLRKLIAKHVMIYRMYSHRSYAPLQTRNPARLRRALVAASRATFGLRHHAGAFCAPMMFSFAAASTCLVVYIFAARHSLAADGSYCEWRLFQRSL
jgi:hypothetical protein